MKRCTVCKEVKDNTEFYRALNSIDGKCYRCKSCDNKARAKWQENNPEKALLSQRKKNLKYKYDMTIEEYDTLLKKQGGCCAICKTTESGTLSKNNNFSVDHAHDDTKKVRGLLCNRCNGALGMFSDDVELLQKAVDYLNKSEAETHQEKL